MSITKDEQAQLLAGKLITFINELIEVNNPDISAMKEFPHQEVFHYFLASAIIEESKKYRIDEKADDLLLNAVMLLIVLARDGFIQYSKETREWDKLEPYKLGREDFAKKVGREIARYAKDSNYLKRSIERWLYDDMDDLLKQLDLKTVDFSNYHPMQFYNYSLDMMKDKNTPVVIGMKRFFHHRLRIGNAVLNRYDWQPLRRRTSLAKLG